MRKTTPKRPLILGCLFASASLVLISSLPLAAHEDYFGFRAGLSIPQLHSGGGSEFSEGYTSRLASNFGIFFGRQFSNHLALQADLLYVGQGGTRDGIQPVPADRLQGLPLPPGTQIYADFKTVAVLNYLEVPLMVKYLFGENRRLHLGAGPYIGYLLNAKTETSGTSPLYVDKSGTPLIIPGIDIPPVDFEASTNIKSDIHPWNAGITGCLDFSTAVGSGELLLDARFTLGLVNIQRDPETNGKNNTGSVLITIGYAFHL